MLLEAAKAAILCNDAELRRADNTWVVDGDPMEGALLSFGVKAGFDAGLLRKQFPRTDEIPFDTEHQFMATLHHSHEGRAFAFIKGAPERVLGLCSRQRVGENEQALDEEFWRSCTDAIASQGQRVLAVAVKEMPKGKRDLAFADVTGGATLLGLLGLIDPPREEALAAVRDCRSAGISVKMITGDHAVTAAAIANQLGSPTIPRSLPGRRSTSLTIRRCALWRARPRCSPAPAPRTSFAWLPHCRTTTP